MIRNIVTIAPGITPEY